MKWRAPGAAVLREPLVHFIGLGALVFAVFGNATTPEDRRIVIDRPRVERLAGQFAQAFRRAPSDAELDALIRDDIKDEVYYREGLRLGLDRDDLVVRRRMRQKLSVLTTSAEDIAAPDDATLERWLAVHPDRFAGEARYSFEQRYLGDADATTSLAALRAGRPYGGSTIPLPAKLSGSTTTEIDTLFGDGFAAALGRAPLGQWSGPVKSAIGNHLVKVTDHDPSRPPQLAAIRQRVENDWRAATAAKRDARDYARLLERYDVVIEQPR